MLIQSNVFMGILTQIISNENVQRIGERKKRKKCDNSHLMFVSGLYGWK